ncbi:pantoate--beta-alanine ligase [Hansschlegelia zhihuaiae]|uniref:Pantothenate synthetase n=1 Tax=Hansschlegelia zhihuaiae TaxID=405005 RepID=A0A4Q0MNJ9_9HYPH|nr:pantoate--beta-alanine ligase [Hansschlegelia zhihuaiae]RXF75105.1 pantoate--beta-alanine ligase [Hansschlegelia zhihuaiae]
MSRPKTVTAVAELRARLASRRNAGERIALVPTMGALHAGHLSLVEQAARVAPRVVVSIFVNPTQFAPHEDLATYPRNLERDLDMLARCGVDLVFAPDVAEMYPDGAATTVTVGGPSEGLESVVRPHFFAGVATVVAKLFVQVAPDVAIFGEKDFQQLAVVRRMARDLCFPIEIQGAPIIRETDGLAMSSRNVYLTDADRARAPELHAALAEAAAAAEAGRDVSQTLDAAKRRIEGAGFAIDYVELRDSGTLRPITALEDRPARLLAAARIGGVRLIDNVAVNTA